MLIFIRSCVHAFIGPFSSSLSRAQNLHLFSLKSTKRAIIEHSEYTKLREQSDCVVLSESKILCLVDTMSTIGTMVSMYLLTSFKHSYIQGVF